MKLASRLLVAISMVCAGAVGLGCGSQGIDLAGLPCDDEGACVEGYVCNHRVGRCAPKIPLGCASSNTTCPTAVRTGSECPFVDTFIPCSSNLEPADCSHGCRTCGESLTWSSCEYPCERGTTADCGFCGDDCAQLPSVATARCDSTGDAPTCLIEACESGQADTDRIVSNGCEDDGGGAP